MNTADILRRTIADLERQVENKKHELICLVSNCPHKWSKAEPDHIYTKGYTIPGDPPGTCGVDWRGPTYVDAKTERRWKRVCSICGEIQHTNKIQQEIIEHPKFN